MVVQDLPDQPIERWVAEVRPRAWPSPMASWISGRSRIIAVRSTERR
ncbi:hypothetical protein [Amycolatopsis rubida]|nr:hypothetical protein [Amycolatopsis rubida]